MNDSLDTKTTRPRVEPPGDATVRAAKDAAAPPTAPVASQPSLAASQPAAAPPPRLSLTAFLDLRTLQEMQDSFAAVTRLSTSIRNAAGFKLTADTEAARRAQSDQMVDFLIAGDPTSYGPLVAPIIVEGDTLGSITIEGELDVQPTPAARAKLADLLKKLSVPDDQVDVVLKAAVEAAGPNKAAAVQFLYLMANAIARLCYQEHQLRQRLEELSALYTLSTLLAGSRNLQEVLDTAARSAAQVMKVKAVSVRLVDEEGKELKLHAVHNLSEQFLSKGPILLDKSPIDREALGGQVVYIADMGADDRVLYPEEIEREGLVSGLVSGMIYQGKPIGVIRLYTGERRAFSWFEVNLLKAISQLLAAAIENTRLDVQRQESQRMQRQLSLAADVQRRMLPGAMPHLPPFDVAARYVPSFELGGDFYDFIDLDGHLGVAVGDVVGKGVAASLLMVAVRSSLRAYAQDVYDIDEIMSRVNIALTRDTLDNEFATVFYGVLDPQALRLTYCNAGHNPPLLMRNNEFTLLSVGGMIVGVDADGAYDKGLLTLKTGDVLVIYTDGLTDALNFANDKFGINRVMEAMRETKDKPARDILNHILWQMRRFTGLNRSIDDTTLVVIKVGK